MITFLTICYCSLVWLIFCKFKWLPWNLRSQVGSVVVGVLAIGELLILIGLYQPYSTRAMIVQQVTPIVARVSGRVIEVPVRPNVPVKKGDVLLKLDPAPYAARVASLKAQLAEAEQNVFQLKARWDSTKASIENARAQQNLARIELEAQTELVKRRVKAQRELDRWRARYQSATAAVAEATARAKEAQIAYESQVDGENTTVARIRADLDTARIDLAETTIYAPEDGYVTNLFVRSGAVTLTAAFSSVMSFVYSSEVNLGASFSQSSLRHIRKNDEAEIALDTQPGRIFRGRVVAILPATGEGALSPSGTLMQANQMFQPGPVVVRFGFEDDMSDVRWTVGTAGAVAIYTRKGAVLSIIRKVMIRIYSWMNYLP